MVGELFFMGWYWDFGFGDDGMVLVAWALMAIMELVACDDRLKPIVVDVGVFYKTCPTSTAKDLNPLPCQRSIMQHQSTSNIFISSSRFFLA